MRSTKAEKISNEEKKTKVVYEREKPQEKRKKKENIEINSWIQMIYLVFISNVKHVVIEEEKKLNKHRDQICRN